MPHFFEHYVKGKSRYTDLLGFKTLVNTILLKVNQVLDAKKVAAIKS